MSAFQLTSIIGVPLVVLLVTIVLVAFARPDRDEDNGPYAAYLAVASVFCLYVGLLALIPEQLESVIIIGLPTLAFLFLFALPLLRPYGERHWSRRPTAVAAVAFGLIFYSALTVVGFAAPWAPVSTEGATLPATVTAGLDPVEQLGARLFVTKGCFA